MHVNQRVLKLILVSCSWLLAGSVTASETVASAGSWVRDAYAPLWETEPWNNQEKLAGFYRETLPVLHAGGEFVLANNNQWLAALFEEWLASGWYSSNLADLRSEAINDSTVAFRMRWEDHYKDGSIEYSCGWYLAHNSGNTWQFTVYADQQCTD